MAVPDFQSLMLPVLRACSDGPSETTQIRARVAASESLSDADLEEMLPSRRMSTFANRVAWAVTYLQIAGLLERVQRGVYQLIREGEAVLKAPPDRLDMKYLERYPSYLEWRHGSSGNESNASDETEPVSVTGSTPEESIEASYRTLIAALQGEMLDRLRKNDSGFFEKVVIDLLIAMGYGAGRTDMGKAIGKSGDGGIDGIIKEDPLGLEIVFVQAKRYGEVNSVGRPEVQGFAGSLEGVGANKGVFFTTSKFTNGAIEYAEKIAKRIVLIDGHEIAKLMIENDVGVRSGAVYSVKRIDEDYFGG